MPLPAHAVRVAVGVVARGGRVLVTCRKEGQLMAGWWEFPGGKVEPDESVTDALVRELREEVGLAVVPVAPLAQIIHTYAHATVHLHPFLASAKEGEPQALEVAACQWVDQTGLAQLSMLPGNRPLVDELLANWARVDAVP